MNPASRSVEKSSSADLLKHLQDRVKKLRAENENLKKSSDNESLARNTRNVRDFIMKNSSSVFSFHKPVTRLNILKFFSILVRKRSSTK